MTQFDTFNVELPNSQLHKVKSTMKNGTELTNLSTNLFGSSNDETNFPHKLLTNTQVSKICKAFANGSSANIKFSKTQLSKMIQSGGLAHNITNTILDRSKMISKIINITDEFSQKVTLDNIMKASSVSKFTRDTFNRF